MCYRCRAVFTGYHDRTLVRLRDLDIASHRVYLWMPRHRVDCPRDGVCREATHLARRGARCTKRFEKLLFTLTKDMTVKAVATLQGVDWEMVKNAEVRYIAGLLRKRDLDKITDLGIDEVSEKKGHRYLTLVTDIRRRRVIWVGRRNDRAVIRAFFRWFGKKRSRRIRRVVIDMHDPYELELRVRCPRASLIYDHFHVIKPMGVAIDNIRRRIQGQLPPEGRRYLKGSRYLLLRPSETLTSKQCISLKELLDLPGNVELTTAYLLKEDLRAVFRELDPKVARTELRDWKRRAMESGIPEIIDYVKMLNRRRFGIQNFFRHRQTNGLSEGFNNVVKTLKKDAYGFHDWRYFRLKILRKCGKLESGD
ncbi:ISL3 family transposase [Methanoregula sp.]|uniref:ISL3 family transposase n=1 Tax=Methanoregula sp. TaxID=2052170 RepID=UPI0025DF5115|nr:ISL3 family transposase [Methanoregula sp.]